nr:ribonuclease H-like domain-containing protein [Tanacetum cinerariifolium]
MQKKKNDVKARTTLLLSLPDEHQLRFSKYKTAKELWAAILKTFGGNEATKKRKKNLLKQQYGNFKAEEIETLEQTFNRLQVIFSTSGITAWRETLSLGDIPTISSNSYCPNSQKKMDHQYPRLAKIRLLDTGQFQQRQLRIQQYLQLEHYALWEVIEFGDSDKGPRSAVSAASRTGRTITPTAEDMQKMKNNVTARTTLLLSLPDEHRLRFSKYKTAKELW